MTINNGKQWDSKLETCLKKSLLEDRALKEFFWDQNDNDKVIKIKITQNLNKI